MEAVFTMTPLARWWRYLHERGVFAAIRAFIDRCVYSSYRCIINYSPAEGPPAVDRIGDVTFRVATDADTDRLDDLDRYARGTTHREYIEKDNDWLVVACDGERIVAVRRASRVIRDRVVSRVITLGPHQFWGADVFCLPEYRNRGIGRHLQVFGDRYLASLGYKDRFGTVNVRNIASVRAARAAGRQPVYYVSRVKILWWERVHVSRTVPRRFWEAV